MVNVKYICDGKNVFSAKYESFNIVIGRKVELKNSSNTEIYVVSNVYDVLYYQYNTGTVAEQNIVVELNFVKECQNIGTTSY